jgi:hypothetical protein
MIHLSPVPRTFSPVMDLGYQYLLTSGCSFTNNNSQEHCISWPLYLRDLGNFQEVFNCSYPGSGNQHIHYSTICEIELNEKLSPENTLVVIMWSGWDRDDFVVMPEAVDQTYFNSISYRYTNEVMTGLTGGVSGVGNLIVNVDSVKKIKNEYSRSLENYLHIVSLQNYLVAKGFNYVFTELNDNNLEIATLLPDSMYQKYTQIVRQLKPTLGTYNQDYLALSFDGVHPCPEVHLKWTRNVLLPFLAANFNIV